MSLPGSPNLARQGAELRLDGCPLDALAREFGTPLYVYSQRAMLDAVAAYRRALADRPHLLCYAMKANPSLAVLQTFAQAGCGFDIVSAGELERVLAAGGDASRVVFSGVGKTRAEMRRALQAGVRCFNVESLGELELLSQQAVAVGRTAQVSLRVNPDVDAGTHPYISTGLKDNKFGIAHDQAVASYRRAAAPARAAGGGHRLPHRLADHAGGALPGRAGPPARPGRGRRGRRHRHPPHRRRRRAGHPVRRRARAAAPTIW